VLLVLAVAAFGYKVLTNVKTPREVLFEEVDEEEGLQSGGDDEEWDYY